MKRLVSARKIRKRVISRVERMMDLGRVASSYGAGVMVKVNSAWRKKIERINM